MIYTPIIVSNMRKADKNMNEFEEVKKVIKENYSFADCGLFFNRNIAGDRMVNIYCKNGIFVDICYDYAYFEAFGLDSVQKLELKKFYNEL